MISAKQMVKFIYSKKATKFCKIFNLLLSVSTIDKSKVKILQNFVAFSEYLKFTIVKKDFFQNFFDTFRNNVIIQKGDKQVWCVAYWSEKF